ncbi:MAG: DHH family phosphoesterase [Oscillospiraceae bacterium]|nr:DHH family phosphoesterase [Oscillospiraceae bacterium]
MTVSEFVDCLRASRSFLLLTHRRPDGDTLCSAAALCSALRRCGKSAALLPNPDITETYAPFVEKYVSGDILPDCTVISVDTAAEHMLTEGFSGRVDLCVDHHGSNTLYAAKSLVRPDKAACGQVIVEIIELLCGELTREEANLLYIALSTDTGCFCYANTDAEALRCGAHLLERGAENGRLNKQLFRSASLSRLALEGRVYSTMRSERAGTVSIAVITQKMMDECGATEDDCDDLASLAGKVRGSVVAVTVREIAPGRSKVSVRTNEQVSACEICARFGGGGHPMASGCTIEAEPYAAADMVYAAVCEVWK